MELGIHIADFTWTGCGAQLTPTLARLAKTRRRQRRFPDSP